MKLEDAYRLFFHPLSNKEDSNIKKTGKVLAAFLVAVFTLGIVHTVVGTKWKNRVKKEVAEKAKAASEKTSQAFNAVQSPDKPIPQREGAKSASQKGKPSSSSQSSSSCSTFNEKKANQEELVFKSGSASSSGTAYSSTPKSSSSQHSVTSATSASSTPSTSFEDLEQTVITPEQALNHWNQTLQEVREKAAQNDPKAKFQLLKWKEEGRMIGDLEGEDKIIEEAAISGVSEALYREIDELERIGFQAISHKETLLQDNTPLGKFYSALVLGSTTPEGKALLREAAQAGCHEALLMQSTIGFNLEGIVKAAKAGSPDAIFHLGHKKLAEFRTNQDDQTKTEAYVHFSKAASLGHPPSIDQMIDYCQESGKEEEMAEWVAFKTALYGEQ